MLTPEEDPVPYMPVDDGAAAHPCTHVGTIGSELWHLGLLHSRLDPIARLVALVLGQRADECGVLDADSQPSLSNLRLETGLLMPHLYQALAALEIEGWIVTGPAGFELTIPVPAQT